MNEIVAPVPEDFGSGRHQLRVAMHLHAIEGNPLDADQVAMFEMFEREGWSFDRRRAFLLARLRQVAAE